VSAGISVLAGLASLLRGKHQDPVAQEAPLALAAGAAAGEAAEDAEEATAAIADPEDAPEARRRRSS
jgi:hypothetical protein